MTSADETFTSHRRSAAIRVSSECISKRYENKLGFKSERARACKRLACEREAVNAAEIKYNGVLSN